MVHWASYKGIWLTDTGLPRQKLVTASVVKTNPAAEEIMRNEQRRCMGYDAAIRALHVAQFTEAAIVVIDSVLSIYNRLKTIHQALDYDDLILLALQLLSRDGVAPWVLYKLDGGLDHVLIDEAQDTSQEQWGVVDRLIADFFAGETARTIGALPRTLFVVGDEKQSIYSFQGASPRAFGEKRHYYADLITGGGAAFEKVELSMSFRSTSAVLDVVDAVISQPYVRAGMDFQGGIVPHEAYRTGQAGLVEVWPVTATEQQEQHTIWDVRREVVNAPDAQFILADRIAKTVRSWLRNAEMLESQNRPIRAGDILVLVRRRNAFMHHLVRAFKRCDVPVAGVDRMVLTENITVMDMLALAEFLLLPEDDLSLACVLKSPLCGLLEDDVFTLAHDRGRQSLWSRVQAHAAYGDCAKFLQQLLERVDYVRPYELFASVLEAQGKRHSFATRMGEEVFDPLDEFLTLALEYERSHAPSLQGFLHWVRSGQTEIKRDMEQGMDAVRIMTVHGSKGLQAPIVFLPDTTDTPGSRNHPLWVQHNGQPVMVWSPSSKEDDAATATLRETYKQAQDEEYRRLLYVAMTRAEDRLYVSGWLGRNRKDVAENCWYRWIVDGARELMQPHTIRFGEEETDILRHHTAQEHPAKAAKAAIEQQPTPDMPDYLRFPPAAEPYPPQPLVPSRSDVEIVQAAGNTGGGVLSPIAEQARFQRGNCIHRLLQWLPDTPPHKRMEAATTYLTQYAADMPQEQRTNMLREVLTVLEHPEMQPVFSAGSLAEVPLSGLVRLREGEAERILNGQIDRLRVTPEAVWIVDYKTQRIPPATAQEVPLAYLRQMAIYRAALAGIYPNRPVHCALLWTAAPCLMMLDADLLASSLDSGQG
jgi:ATP-dependent helicase/nuclease subunit A